MSPHPPAILIPLLNQPIMPQHLRIEVKNLKRRMMDMCFWSCEEEKGVVIHELETAVQMHEGNHVVAIGLIDYLKEESVSGWKKGGGEGGKDAYVGGFEVEVGCPERHVCCEISYAYAEVAELVNLSWAWETVRRSVAVLGA